MKRVRPCQRVDDDIRRLDHPGLVDGQLPHARRR